MLRVRAPAATTPSSFFAFFAALFVCLIVRGWCVAAVVFEDDVDLLLVTIATDETDGLKRLRRSADEFGLRLRVFGLDEAWTGGDVRFYSGGAQKIRILHKHLEPYKTREDLLVLFVDGYDVLLNGGKADILRRFFTHFSQHRVVFGADPFCYPQKELTSKYPNVVFGERFLNSGMFIGYAASVYEMLELARANAGGNGNAIADDDDDQLIFTRLYLDEHIRDRLKMGLDSLTLLFLNLYGATDVVKLEWDTDDGFASVHNPPYNSNPVVIHGNGFSKLYLNALGNYIARGHNAKTGLCRGCEKDAIIPPFEGTLVLALFITKPVPYVEEFLHAVLQLAHPKGKTHLFVFNSQEHNRELVAEFLSKNGELFASTKALIFGGNDDDVEEDERAARAESIQFSIQREADALLMLDADAHFKAANTIDALIHHLKSVEGGIVAPLLIQPGKLFSNFWGALSADGFYARSNDYVSIAEGRQRGVWNVPFANAALLVTKAKLPTLVNAFTYNAAVDADMSFAQFCRDHRHFIFVDNIDEYGFLVNSDGFGAILDAKRLYPEIYDYPNNKQIWEKRYIHPEYFEYMPPPPSSPAVDAEKLSSSAAAEGKPIPQVCPDVYDFPFLSERFSREIIEIMEHFGKWSDGGHSDRRLEGGYENVPTRDIHMNQVGLERQFLQIIDDYVAPVQEKVFIGFYQRPVRSNMMFVVRYRTDEQSSLRPHHDASTYSIDLALNKRGVDYEGGGVRFVRYNCTIPADQVGWSMLFPGRLTHLHEGLPTTSGTRYILVSFINP